ncbi:hypothetical protein SAMN03159341_105119 [Paenibacillus sp. 1_12]|uniref:hypothetical protein n=1 Tax=Paenibacillus sp. 1_12 TaxID=1566278 RepID=UPI0008DF006C|nr:hypothetical protein [Paenibacillus sp. 1_12]SFL33140.1 hypothetical protein SAMN03159341_105119 [Paenibacillus sp. 1_12]
MTRFKPSKANDPKDEQEMTNAAWARLQAALEEEDEQPEWLLLGQRAAVDRSQEAAEGYEQETQQAQTLTGGQAIQTPLNTIQTALNESDVMRSTGEMKMQKRAGAFSSWVRRNNKRICIATAACLLVGVIATPIGNEALASILNKFRMQQITVVDENDLQLFYSATKGETRESVNKFGDFTQVSGNKSGDLTAVEGSKLLGRSIVVPKDWDAKEQKLHISPSNAITLKLKVDEVNKTMSRLGAKKLLPQSIDGKPITLEIGESVHIYTSAKERPGYSFTQQPVPVLIVDPGIPLAEAYDAVLHFPLLPDSLKESLQQTNVLSGGTVPLPVVTNGQSEKLKLNNLDVIVTTISTGRYVNYMATWVKNGQLFTLNGGQEVFASRQALLDQATELTKL